MTESKSDVQLVAELVAAASEDHCVGPTRQAEAALLDRLAKLRAGLTAYEVALAAVFKRELDPGAPFVDDAADVALAKLQGALAALESESDAPTIHERLTKLRAIETAAIEWINRTGHCHFCPRGADGTDWCSAQCPIALAASEPKQ